MIRYLLKYQLLISASLCVVGMAARTVILDRGGLLADYVAIHMPLLRLPFYGVLIGTLLTYLLFRSQNLLALYYNLRLPFVALLAGTTAGLLVLGVGITLLF
jgi:hypothetical protein